MPTVKRELRCRVLDKLNDGPCSVSKLADALKIRREFLSGFLEAMKEGGELTVIDVGVAKVYMPVGSVEQANGGDRP